MTVDKNPEVISNMFDNIAQMYDRNNNIISLGLHKFVKTKAISELNLKDGQSCLDLCCGTGDILQILSEKNLHLKLIGVDFSEKMLVLAKEKLSSLQVEFIRADVSELPFDEEKFDVITMFFGLRNVYDRAKTLKEIYRVMKYNGEFLHLDFGVKNAFSKLFDIVAIIGIKIFYKNKLPYEYLINSKSEFPTPEKLIKEFTDAGFRLKKRKDFLFGIISGQIFTK